MSHFLFPLTGLGVGIFLADAWRALFFISCWYFQTLH